MAGFHDIGRIEDLALDGRRVLVRVDMDCPVDENGRVTDDSKIQACLPTIRHLISEGAKVVLASSFGAPGGRRNAKFSLTPVGERLTEILDCEVYLPEDTVGEGPWKVIMERVEGEVVLLENLGFYAEDERNDDFFAQRLFMLADVYVNEAFRLSGKVLASTVGVCSLFNEKTIGFKFRKEIEALGKLTNGGDLGLGFVLGGPDDGLGVEYLNLQLGRVQKVMIAGKAALPFYAARGWRTGMHKVDKERVEVAGKILSRAALRGVDIELPIDLVVVATGAGDDDSRVVRSDSIPEGFDICDIGPATTESFCAGFKGLKTILWSGALGNTESATYLTGTAKVAKAVIRSSAAATVVGDEMANVVNKLVLNPFFAHVSAGGDAGMEMLLGKELPAIKALRGGS